MRKAVSQFRQKQIASPHRPWLKRCCGLLLGFTLLAIAPAIAWAGASSSGQRPLSAAAYTLEIPAGANDNSRSSEHADAGQGSVQFIGTATVLIRYAGLTILTDPNFLHKGDHVHLGYGLKSQRLTEPAMPLEDLPQIDLIVLSHMHGDHFDQLVQQKLDRKIPIVSTPQAAAILQQMGFKTTYALKDWDELTVSKGSISLKVTAMPGRHGPPVAAKLLPQVMGSMLEFMQEGKTGYRMYISGDTLVYADIEQIPQRYPDIDLALLHLGGTRILGILKVTMDGQDGVRMLQLVAPHHAIPIHYSDYDVFKSPLSDFQREVKAAGLESKITYLNPGERYTFKAADNNKNSR